ncbi:two-component system response regulator BaeR [Variovorax sp. WS11]|uniref:response regulator n=1 Tax=Variovorax sp. WS11 TaxID=1105204 RepID=UPI000D0DC6B4|nr:response regulator [Variovorax sp. WS11]NDZ17372.1 response regulator [Variovorax sp. WS11]PSL86091.1 two-component system response regulator BaeR [Variovorax sp. WS11]
MIPAPAAHILIVEDEPKLARLLVDYLQADGFACSVVADGLEALPAVRERAPALVILDLMLPGRDGVSICRELRGFSTVPVIMVTARVDEVDRLLGLEVGADDYICKPYSPREVVARVRAQLRRVGWTGRVPATDKGGLAMDDAALRATIRGRALDLTPAEFRLLRTLAAQPGRVFSRNDVLDRLHNDSRAITDRAVDSHVRNLRRKLTTATDGVDPIRSVYGVGYAFEWPIDCE